MIQGWGHKDLISILMWLVPCPNNHIDLSNHVLVCSTNLLLYCEPQHVITNGRHSTSQFHHRPVRGRSFVPVTFLCPVQSCSHTPATRSKLPTTSLTWRSMLETIVVPPCRPKMAPLCTQSGSRPIRPAYPPVYDSTTSRGVWPTKLK